MESQRLLDDGCDVVGLDNLNEYYDPSLKRARLAQLTPRRSFRFIKMDLVDRAGMATLFKSERFEIVLHLAAQAGVRYSLTNPFAYVDSNLVGFANILEGCRHNGPRHLVFASSSSVYGANAKMPFSVRDNVDHPISLYAATKKANELMAHAYAHLCGLPCTGLRLFTVYGPWGRPDMALFLFTARILEDKPIDIYNYGNMRRDFTYIDDVIECVVRVMERVPQPDPCWDAGGAMPGSSSAPYRIYNIGNNNPENLMHVVGILEMNLGKKAKVNLLANQAGDVPATHADVSELARDVGFQPRTPLEVGVERFVRWYRSFYKV